MMTPEAEQEIKELTIKCEQINIQRDKVPYQYKSERYRLDRIYYNARDKIDEIKKLGISSNERKAVVMAIPNMFKVSGGRDIAYHDGVVVGFIKKFNGYFKVRYSKGSQFLRNVRGMGSEAGKTTIYELTQISEETYKSIVEGVRNAGGAEYKTSFMGATQTTRR